ncbi:Card1-like endonuclease domain-containing protein [Pseudoalteromonas sp. SS15]|uniref:Card1-like endonuclease domain-containing protein n=1 Tax=Pseudoalteromonas sp. SS15 TaxID=3139393 RepID=UPI003BABDB8C
METLHINLVSEQVTANLIPAFSDSNCTGVILVQGDDKLENKSKILNKLYAQRDIPVIKEFKGTSSHIISELNKQANELLDYLETNHKDKFWVLNVTCGTKPMSLAMTLAMQNYNAQRAEKGTPALIIYTDSQNKIIHILNNQQQSGSLPYNSTLTLDELLTANDFNCSDRIDRDSDFHVRERAELTEYLGKQFSEKCRGMLGQLQGAASKAAQNFSPNFTQTIEVYNKLFTKVYNRLAEAELIQCQWQDGQSVEIKFTSEEACRYLAGLWLEELAYLQALKCGFDEVAMSVEGVWDDKHAFYTKGKNNEFDILINHNNQLLTVECKARNWQSKTNQSISEQDLMHKLDNLGSKLGGLYAQNLLISAYTLTDAMVNRAKTNRIKVCDNATQEKLLHTFMQLKQQMGN